MGIVVMLNNVRLSFPKLDAPDYFQGKKQRENDKRRWSAAFHIAPASTAQFVTDKKLMGAPAPAKAFIDAVLVKCATEKWADKAKTHLSNILPDPKGCCWMDGARKDQEGVWILSSHRTEDQGRPIVMDNDMSPVYDRATGQMYSGKAGRIYSGMYVNAQVEFWAQDNAAGKALRATLMAIQRFKDGDAFSGATAPVTEAFGEVADGSDADDLS
jgi:hypothetical protein